MANELPAAQAAVQPQNAEQQAKPAPTQENPGHDPKMAELVKRERDLRNRQRAIQEQENKWKAREEQESISTKYQQLMERLEKDPWSVLKERGVTYDSVTQRVLEETDPDAQRYSQLQNEIKQLKQSQEQQQKAAQENQQKQYEQAVNQISRDVKQLVGEGQDYEAIRETGSHEAVVELIKSTFDETGELLTVEAAAREVEEYLVEQGLRMASLQKVQAKRSPQPESADGATTTNPSSAQQGIKTITNNIASGNKPMSARERALLAFQGKLTS